MATLTLRIQGEHIPDALKDVIKAASETATALKMKSEIADLPAAFTYKIQQDDGNGSNPREWDNYTWLYEHNATGRRSEYGSPDKGAYDPWNAVEGKVIDNIFVTEDEDGEVCRQLGSELEEGENLDEAALDTWSTQWEATSWEKRYTLDSNVACCMEYSRRQDGSLYLGSAPLDRVIDEDDYRRAEGFAFVTEKTLLALQGEMTAERRAEVMEKLPEWIKSEVKVYSQWATGDVWYFLIEDENEDYVDSCGGFIGWDWEEVEHMLEYAEEIHHEGLKAAWDRRFD